MKQQDAKVSCKEILIVHSAETFPADLPILKRTKPQHELNYLAIPSPLSLPSDFSVDIADTAIPLHSLQDSNFLIVREEEMSSTLAVHDSVLVPGLFEKAKASLQLCRNNGDSGLTTMPQDIQGRSGRFPSEPKEYSGRTRSDTMIL
jgi:hypothetical protein